MGVARSRALGEGGHVQGCHLTKEVIQLLKGKDFGIDLQFINMRS